MVSRFDQGTFQKSSIKKVQAQGTIEYLVIMAVVIVIGLIVVGMMSNFFDSSSGISGSLGKINALTGPISISETVVDSDGNGYSAFTNNSGETLTITKINLGGVDNNYNKLLASGGFAVFGLDNLLSGCTCSVPGESKTCSMTVYFTSVNGISNSITKSVTVDCVNDATTDKDVTNPQDDSSVIFLASCADFNSLRDDMGANAILTQSFSCTGFNFNMLGSTSDPFNGTLDGGSFTISDISITSSQPRVAIFDSLNEGAIIKDINFWNVSITNSSTSSITKTAGLIIDNNGDIIGTTIEGEINQGGVSTSPQVAGLVITNRGDVNNSSFEGDIYYNAFVGADVAGFIMDNGGNINSCFTLVFIEGYSGYLASSLAGFVVGNSGVINNSYSNVSGFNFTPESYCGIGEYSVAFLGEGGIVNNSYATGVIDMAYISGSCDNHEYGLTEYGVSATNSYWNSDDVSQSAQGTAKTTSQLKQQSTFVDWDFSNIWNIDVGVDYPRLQWE